MNRHPSRQVAGFTLVELLVSMAVVTIICGAALALFAPLQAASDAASAQADLTQRLRVGTAVLAHDLAQAGSGLVVLDEHGGFGALLPAVLPDAVPPPGAGARPVGWVPSTIGLLHAPPTAMQARLASAAAGPFDPLRLEPTPFCSGELAPCGYGSGISVALFDASGAWEIVTLSGVDEASRSLLHATSALTRAYDAGTVVARVSVRTYSLRDDPASGASILVRDEGSGVAQPVLDHVVAFGIDLLGEPAPPEIRAIHADGRSWTTYGPPPPPVDAGGGAWPQGENCAFERDGAGDPQPRLAPLGSEQALVPLGQAALVDGPWCPDPLAVLRYDADLLRVRQVAVRLRVQVASAMLRGPVGALFAGGGTGRARVLVPDREVRFAVALRSLVWGR